MTEQKTETGAGIPSPSMPFLAADHPGVIEAARRIQQYWSPSRASCLPPHTRSGVPMRDIAKVIADAINEHTANNVIEKHFARRRKA